MNEKSRIIVPLDTKDIETVTKLVRILGPHVNCFKVGLELISSLGGPQIVKYIHELGGKVFYDGKFCDIPNTVGASAKAISALNVEMFNVHASCGIRAMEAAVTNKGESKVLAVTVLTSLDEDNTYQIFGASTKDKVIKFAFDAQKAGCDGIICSPKELGFLGEIRQFDDMLKITPGVRPEWASLGDQKRVMTPGEAIKAGATALVIGRPITNPPKEIGSPLDAVISINAEVTEALEEMARSSK
jgi:orotidine-5'-phosphate decarboxylase